MHRSLVLRRALIALTAVTGALGLVACEAALGLGDYHDRDADGGAAGGGNDASTAADGDVMLVDGGTAHDGAAMGDAPVLVPVSGTVYDRTFAPVASAKVRLGNRPVVVTGADGTFIFADVPATYDLDVVGPMKDARSFRGLTTRAPQVGVSAPVRSAPVTYAFSNALGANDRVVPFFVDGRSDQGLILTAASGTTSATWTGASPATGVVGFWITTVDGAGKLTDIKAGSILKTPLTENVGFTFPVPTLPAITSSAITGTFQYNQSVSAALNYSATAHYPGLPPGGHVYLGEGAPSQATFSIPTPMINGATIDVCFGFTVGTNRTAYSCALDLAPNTTGLSATYAYAAAAATLPLDGANDVSTITPFSWSSAPGTFESFLFCNGVDYTLSVVTTGLSMQLPDLTDLGVALPAKGTCSWDLWSYPTQPAADAFVGDIPTKIALARSSYSSERRTFTAK